MSRAQAMLHRQLRALHELGRAPRGLSSEALAKRLGCSRPTINRDLDALKRSGAPLGRKLVNGDRRHYLVAELFPGVPRHVATALQVARAAIHPLRGSAIHDALEDALRATRGASPAAIEIASPKVLADPAVVSQLERAILSGRRVRVEVVTIRSGGAPTEYDVEPARLVVKNDDLYLDAWKLPDEGWRTFKVIRIRALTDIGAVPKDVARALPPLDGAAVKVWEGTRHRVVLRFSKDAVAFAREYPLVPTATFEPTDDGRLISTAIVNGLVEARSRILSWGARVEVLEPRELREAIGEELARAARQYDASGSLTDRERSSMATPYRAHEKTRTNASSRKRGRG